MTSSLEKSGIFFFFYFSYQLCCPWFLPPTWFPGHNSLLVLLLHLCSCFLIFLCWYFFFPIALLIFDYLLVHKLAPILMQSKKKSKKEAGHFILVGGRFNKQGNLQRRLVLGGSKLVALCTHPPESLALTGLSHVVSPDGLHNTLLSQNLCPWKWLPLWELWTAHIFWGQGRRWGVCLGPACRSTSSQILQHPNSTSGFNLNSFLFSVNSLSLHSHPLSYL